MDTNTEEKVTINKGASISRETLAIALHMAIREGKAMGNGDTALVRTWEDFEEALLKGRWVEIN